MSDMQNSKLRHTLGLGKWQAPHGNDNRMQWWSIMAMISACSSGGACMANVSAAETDNCMVSGVVIAWSVEHVSWLHNGALIDLYCYCH